MNLADYQIDVAALLHDSNHLFTGLFQLNRWINEARDQVAQDTGCLRALVSGQAPFGSGAQPGLMVPGGAIPGQSPFNGFQTIPQQEVYAYTFANQYLNKTGYRSVMDVNNVAVSWGGSIRPVQDWMPWDDLQAYARSYNIGIQSYPFCWSNTGSDENGQIWLFPAPSEQTEMEWDCLCLPTELNKNSDFEAIPKRFARAVKYAACALAFDARFNSGQADKYRERYADQITTAAAARERMRVPQYYGDWTTWT